MLGYQKNEQLTNSPKIIRLVKNSIQKEIKIANKNTVKFLAEKIFHLKTSQPVGMFLIHFDSKF